MNLTTVGKRMGKRTILSEPFKFSKHREKRVIVRCDCGRDDIVRLRGMRPSCVTCSHTRHGHAKRGKVSRTFRSWESMRRRCNDISYQDYRHYGGRGITYAPAWEDFDVFLADMGECPPKRSLDRINVNGNYGVDNCRWATAKEQRANQRPTGTDDHDWEAGGFDV